MSVRRYRQQYYPGLTSCTTNDQSATNPATWTGDKATCAYVNGTYANAATCSEKPRNCLQQFKNRMRVQLNRLVKHERQHDLYCKQPVHWLADDR